MGNEKQIIFDPFSLDLANECLWKGSQAIKTQTQGLRRARAISSSVRPTCSSKKNSSSAVWPGTFVGDAVLKVTIRQIREALDDDPKLLASSKLHIVGAIASSVRSQRASRGQRPPGEIRTAHALPVWPAMIRPGDLSDAIKRWRGCRAGSRDACGRTSDRVCDWRSRHRQDRSGRHLHAQRRF